MATRRPLPISPPPPSRPTVDAIRTRLGGRALSQPGTGAFVRALTPRGECRGVVLFVAPDTVDVWVDEGRVQRVARTAVEPAELPAALVPVATDAHVFARLGEGHRVRYHDPHGVLAEGVLREKCRWGAIVERDDGVLIGVGFRRVWPAGGGVG